jgi:pyruvate dehydrogenase E2 component (dihydrolipoamide acetyltransferase)
MASDKGLNLSTITGTGPNGRIIAADIEEYKVAAPQAQAQDPVAQAPVAKAPAAGSTNITAGLPDPSISYDDLTNSQIRKVIAERLTYSKQNIPHYYVTIQVQVDNLLALREKLNKHSTSKISVNDMVIKAASLAAMKVP